MAAPSPSPASTPDPSALSASGDQPLWFVDEEAPTPTPETSSVQSRRKPAPHARSAAKYVIAGEGFASKRALADRVRTILHGAPIGEIPQEHLPFLSALLARHPQAAQKIGPGIRKFYVLAKTHPAPHRGLMVERVDGSVADFSYQKCIREPSATAKFIETLRREVVDQITAFRHTAFTGAATLECPITKQQFDKHTAEVHHATPSFAALVASFLEVEHIDPAACEIASPDFGSRSLVNRELAERWRAFHRANARLKIMSSEGHKTITKKDIAP